MFKDFLVREAVFHPHFKFDPDNRFNLRLRNLDLNLSDADGKPFPEDLYDLAEKRCKQVLTYLGSTVLDAFDLPESIKEDVHHILVAFPEIELKAGSRTLSPTFITSYGKDGSNKPGNVFAAIIPSGPINRVHGLNVRTIMCHPRDKPNGELCSKSNIKSPGSTLVLELDRERVEAGKKAKVLAYGGNSRRKLTIDLDESEELFNASWPTSNLHGRDNYGLQSPEDKAAYDAAKAAVKGEADQDIRTKLAASDGEAKTARQMGLMVGTQFMYADWEDGDIVARKYSVVEFNVQLAGSSKTTPLEHDPNKAQPKGNVLVVRAEGVTTKKTKFLKFEQEGRQYIIGNSSGMYIDSIGVVKQERDKSIFNLILVGAKQHAASSAKEIHEGQILTGIKIPKKA